MTAATATTCHHYWTPTDDGHQCEQCGATCPACNVCNGPTGTALLVCQRCLDRCDEVLDGITAAMEHYEPPSPSPVPAVRYDRDRRGSNDDRTPLRLVDSPEQIEAILLDWVALWADLSGQAENVAPVEYLRGRHLWAAHNAEAAAWDDYRQEMRQLRHRARRMAGLLPQRQAGSCIYCGGDVVRDWADEHWRPRADGLSDDLRCTACRTQWEDVTHWRYANRHTILALPETHPELLVTAADSRAIFPEVPASTWRSWRRRDLRRAEVQQRHRDYLATGAIGPEPEPERMPVRSWDARGRELYRLADLTAHVVARADETRPGRKAC